MTRTLAVLLALSAAGTAAADEKGVVERLKAAGAEVKTEFEGRTDILAVSFPVKHTDADLAELCELRRLQVLRLGGKGVTDQGMRIVGGLTELRDLSMGGARITDAGFAELAHLRNLEWLDLVNTHVTDKSMGLVGRMRKLEVLRLDNCRITDAGVRELAGLSQLICLQLPSCQVTDMSVEVLAGLRNLTYLDVFGTKITAQGGARLMEALPRARIIPFRLQVESAPFGPPPQNG